MCGATLPLPQNASMAWCSVEAQGQLYLYPCNLMPQAINSFPLIPTPYPVEIASPEFEKLYTRTMNCSFIYTALLKE